MEWRFWTRISQPQTDTCEEIRPLLSLHTDEMASTEEILRVEDHVAHCDSCRQSLNLMQATHVVLAHRPAKIAPPDMRARIAFAIAASEQSKVKQPAFRIRTSYRPVFAMAATILIAVIAGRLLLTSAPVTKTPIASHSIQVAQEPPASTVAPKSAIGKHSGLHVEISSPIIIHKKAILPPARHLAVWRQMATAIPHKHIVATSSVRNVQVAIVPKPEQIAPVFIARHEEIRKASPPAQIARLIPTPVVHKEPSTPTPVVASVPNSTDSDARTREIAPIEPPVIQVASNNILDGVKSQVARLQMASVSEAPHLVRSGNIRSFEVADTDQPLYAAMVYGEEKSR